MKGKRLVGVLIGILVGLQFINVFAEDSIPKYNVWLANSCMFGLENSGNGLYQALLQYQDPVYRTLGENLIEDDTTFTLASAWNKLLDDEAKKNPNYIYEAVIMDYLKYEANTKDFENEMLNNTTDFFIKIYHLGVSPYVEEGLDSKHYDEILDAKDFNETFRKLGVTDKALKVAKEGGTLLKDVIKELANIQALEKAKEERVELLKQGRDVAKQRGDNDLVMAADALLEVIEGNSVEYISGKSIGYAWNNFLDKCWDFAIEGVPYLKLIDTTKDLGKAGLDVLFNTSKGAENDLKLAVLYLTDSYFKEALSNATDDFRNNKTSEICADSFNACLIAYAEFQIYGNSYAKTWIENVVTGGFAKKWVEQLFFKENLETAKDLIVLAESQIGVRNNYLVLLAKYGSIYSKKYNNKNWEEWLNGGNVPVTSISFPNSTINISKGTPCLVDAQVYPSNASNKNIKYVCSDPDVVSVPEDGGFATIKKQGTVTVTATSEDGGHKATLTINAWGSIAQDEEHNILDKGMCGDNVSYVLYKNGSMIIAGEGKMWDWDDIEKVPWNDYAYNKSGNYLNNGLNHVVNNVVIKDGVTTIGHNAFQSCWYLYSINIPNSVESIGGAAFYYCGLRSINIPNSVNSIGNYAFYYCGSLKSISISNNITCIGEGTFAYCDSLESINIPNGVISIEDNAFEYCSSLKSIRISNSVTSIGEEAFYRCESLESIKIPNGVKEIGTWAFSCCNSLVSVSIPNSVTNLSSQIFEFDNSLEEVTIGDGIEKEDLWKIIDGGWNTTPLKNIYVTEDNSKYSSIDGVLYNKEKTELICYPICHEGNSVVIPKSVKSITFHSVYYPSLDQSKYLKNLYVDGENSKYSSIDGVLYDKKKTELIFYPRCHEGNSYVIQKSVKSINDWAFKGCESLKSLKFESGDITFNSTLPFFGCDSLINIELGKDVNEISASIWKVISIDTIKNIEVEKTNSVYSSYNGVLYDKDRKWLEACPSGKTGSLNIPTSVEHITFGSFSGCKSLTNIQIPNSVTEIPGKAFKDCESLKNIVLHNKITEVGVDAFRGCDSLESITVLNKNCKFYDGKVIPNDTVIYGYSGSSAEEYAKNNGNTFKAINCKNHKWDSGKVTKKATCKETGIKTYSCTVCGETKTEVIPKIAHTYKTTITKAKPGTNGSTVNKCSVCGDIKSKTVIYAPKTLTLSKTSYVYNGKVLKPTVTVKDSKGTTIASSNYTVTYASGRKNVGTYKVTVTFKGTKYTESLSKTFTINPKSTTLKSLTALSKGFTVKWNKLPTQTTGYQIQYSTNSKFTSPKTINITKNSIITKKIVKLSSKKKYYVRIRTYKTVNGKKYYSTWSSSKTVTTNK